MTLLDRIKKENDIQKLEPEELPLLAEEIRSFLVGSIAKTGGHLAPNLGTVELTIALHRCMHFPEDKLIFDVGHQSYTHKILTGRKDAMVRLRQFGGISGFPKTGESDADAFNTGHSSTSLSAAVGFLAAREHFGTKEKICAVIGDGSMTGGMVYEALDQLSQFKSNCVIVLNDNEMSISKNVGGLSRSLNRLRVGKSYNELKSGVENALLNIPEVGERVAKGIKRSKDSIKNLFVDDTIFSDMGITYIGPVDGHNISELTGIFERAFRLEKPVLVHVKTVKGKGYQPAERYPEHFHGVGPYDPKTGRSIRKKTEPTNTDVFARTLLRLGRQDERIIAITAAMAGGTGVKAFQRTFPDRTFDVGIAEQHAVTFAAGLAMRGLVPVVAIYSSFLQRAYDQILHDVCLQNLHVIFAIDRSGINGEDGETHQGIYDTAYLRTMPNLEVLCPKGQRELEEMLQYAVKRDGPVAIKYSKETAWTGMDAAEMQIVPGRCEVLSFAKSTGNIPHKSLCIFAAGCMVKIAKEVADRMTEELGLTPQLVNIRFLKPLDRERIREAAQGFDLVAVLEESIRDGSFGEEAAYEMLLSGGKARLLHFCIHSDILQQGSIARLRKEEGLDADSIYDALKKAVTEV